APGGQGAARGDPPGRADALPADPDDDAGGAVRRAAADVRLGRRRRAAAPARPGDLRRPGGEPAADAVHDAGDLPRLRSPRPDAAWARGAARRRQAGVPVGRAALMNLSRPFVERPVATALLTIG